MKVVTNLLALLVSVALIAPVAFASEDEDMDMSSAEEVSEPATPATPEAAAPPVKATETVAPAAPVKKATHPAVPGKKKAKAKKKPKHAARKSNSTQG
jgi:outer membrane biosynthesis protein TonB